MHFAIGLWFGSVSSSLWGFGDTLIYVWHVEVEPFFQFNLLSFIGGQILKVF